MIRLYAAICYCLCCALTPARAAGPVIPDDVKQNIRERVEANLSPGIVVGVIDTNGAAYFSAGTSFIEGGSKVDENTLFEIGSITKVFTAILLADAIERGQLDIKDPIDKLLPGGQTVPSRGGRHITLENLVTHRSALPRLPTNMSPADVNNPYADYSKDDLYKFLATHKPTWEIGSKYEYSNLGFGLLGHILSRKADKPFEDLVIERICKPLSMTDTVIKRSAKQRRRAAKGHADGREVRDWDFDCLAGCGALRSTVRDLLRFVGANIGLKSSPISAALRRCHRGEFDTGARGLHMAMGWHVWTRNDKRIIWHNGGTGGFHSFCGFNPKDKIGVVVLANSSESIDDIAMHILDPERKLKKIKTTATVAAATLEEYVGYYSLNPSVTIHITREGDSLFAQLTGQPRAPVFAASDTKFFYRVVEAELTFSRNADGAVTAVTLHQGGADQKARKLGAEYKPPPPRTEVSVSVKTLNQYVGTYQLVPNAVFDVSVQGNKLMVGITGQPTVQVFPESESTFFYKVVDAQITFVKDDSGKVTALVLHQGGMDQTARKTK